MILDSALILWYSHKQRCCAAVLWELHGAASVRSVLVKEPVSFWEINLYTYLGVLNEFNNHSLTAGEHEILCGLVPGQIMNPITNHSEEIDECALMPTMCTHGNCMNTPGSFECQCNRGYIYDQDSHQCIDENECQQVFCNVLTERFLPVLLMKFFDEFHEIRCREKWHN